jgi:hypothetical protein
MTQMSSFEFIESRNKKLPFQIFLKLHFLKHSEKEGSKFSKKNRHTKKDSARITIFFLVS